MRNRRMRDERRADFGSQSRDDVDDSFGNPASAKSGANSSIEADVNSDGLMTAVHPAASAGASFQLVSVRGEFHGVMIAITPLGSYLV